MLEWLEEIFHAIESIPYWIATALVDAVNLLIAGLAGIGKAALAVLPGFPTVPSMPSAVLRAFVWFFPLEGIMAGFAALVASYVTYLGIRVVLNWAKAN